MKKFPKTLYTSQGVASVLDPSRILVAFKRPMDLKEVSGIAERLKLTLESNQRSKENVHWVQVNHTPQRYWLKKADGSPIDDKEFAEIEKNLGSTIDWIGPVYQNPEDARLENCYCPVPDVVLIRKNQKVNIETVGKEFGLTVDENKSKYLSAFYYLRVQDVKKSNAYELKTQLAAAGNEVIFENMPMMKPLTATIPNDTFWANQWNMAQINAPNGWDITTGSNSVVICILDEGCDLTHPDLQFSEPGRNLDTMLPPGSPTGEHGTACAGIAAGTFNNNAGVAGVAGNCRIMPLAFQNWSDVECALGISYATANGANVISMSFGVYAPGEGPTFGWNMAVVDPEIQLAFNNDVVMCAATGNENRGDFNRYPGRHPLVMGVGGTSRDDNRKSPASPDGECWGANFGQDIYNGVTTGVSVVAPCVQCPTTDIQGAAGYNNNGALIFNPWACVLYPAQPADGNYMMVFDGTSAATPHVAGLAGLIKSQYPSLTNVQIRRAIETSAAKVGALPYAAQAGFPNGTRNQEMGYGRIDVFAALKVAEKLVSCKDLKDMATTELQQIALDKQHHLKSLGSCPDFKFYTQREEKCKPADFPRLKPCFYFHWGDGRRDNIETEDYEVVILSVCNPYDNVVFKNIVISEIEITHADGTPVELLPDGTPSVMIVPSRLITFCSISPCSCSHIELSLKTSGALEGRYKIRLKYCIGEISLQVTERDRTEFEIELVVS